MLTAALSSLNTLLNNNFTSYKRRRREDAMNVNDIFRRQVGIPSRPSALPTGMLFTSLRSPSIVSNSSSKVLSQDSIKSRKLTQGGFMLAAKLGPVGSLSKGVFERRTATGNEAFSLFTRLGATAFVKLSVFALFETIYLKIRAHPMPKNEKHPLPVAVCRSKTPLLKLPNIGKIPVERVSYHRVTNNQF